jgi:hypothetical protein
MLSMRGGLKVEYLSRIEYDFQKSRVTGPWDHKVSVSAKKFHACVPLNHREGGMVFYHVFLLSPLQCTVTEL